MMPRYLSAKICYILYYSILITTLSLNNLNANDNMFNVVNKDNVNSLQIIDRVMLSHPFESEISISRMDTKWLEDNRLLVNVVGASSVNLIDIDNNKIDQLCETETYIWQFDVINDEQLICLDRENRIWLVDIETGTELYRQEFDSEWSITSLAVSPYNQYVFIMYSVPSENRLERRVSIWSHDLSDQVASFTIGSQLLWQMSFDNTGNYIIFYREGTPQMWDIQNDDLSMNLWAELNEIDYSTRVVFSSDNSLFAVDGDAYITDGVYRTAFLYRLLPYPQLIYTFVEMEIAPYAFTRSDDMLIVGIGPRNEQLAFVDIQDSVGVIVFQASKFELEYENIVDITLSSEGRFIATLHEDATLLIWGVPCDENCAE